VPEHFSRTRFCIFVPERVCSARALTVLVFGHKKTFVLALVLAVLLSFSMQGLLLRRSPVPSASAVVANANIGVYWDRGCTQNVSSIDWGTLEPGGTQQVVVYVLNEGNDTFNLDLAPQDWQPANASDWLSFSWSCRNTTIAAGHVVKVTQTLSVASDFPGGFSSFSFSIVFGEGSSLLEELAIVAAAYGSHCANYDYQGEPASPNWNPNADLNKDGVVNLLDLYILASEYGQT